jgi:hypothetical protein
MLLRRPASPVEKALFWIAMVFATFVTLAALAAVVEPVVAFGRPRHGSGRPNDAANSSSSILAEFALGKVLEDASPAFGEYQDVQSSTSTWSVSCKVEYTVYF